MSWSRVLNALMSIGAAAGLFLLLAGLFAPLFAIIFLAIQVHWSFTLLVIPYATLLIASTIWLEDNI